ncbi:Ctr copper transporter family-domain-containing protein, partial [Xylariaceae sp. FL0016]
KSVPSLQDYIYQSHSGPPSPALPSYQCPPPPKIAIMDMTSTTMSSSTDILTTATSGHSTFAFTPPGLGQTPKATASATGDNMPGMSGMSGMDMQEGECQISMLWNWHTIDACFLSESWHIRSQSGFAGLCIGVILIVFTLEVVRLAQKKFDAYLIAQRLRTHDSISSGSIQNEVTEGALIVKYGRLALPPATPFRPNVWQQAIRALLHTIHFALAYWVMLLAMYYNGYIIICILSGAFLGSYICRWERIGPVVRPATSHIAGGAVVLEPIHGDQPSEPTGCCG